MDTGRLHHEIIESFVQRGVAPTSAELEDRLNASTTEVVAGLRALEAEHGVVLHPHAPEVWIAHPFTASPGRFTVRGSNRDWWAPCAWCALGVAAIVEEDVEVVTLAGADASPASFRVVDGRLNADEAFVVHFPIPMTRVWDNVVHTCCTMLLFRGESEVDRWSESSRIPKGDVQPLATVWELARIWYGDHRSPEWRKWTAAEARSIFDRVGLGGPIWELPGAAGRF